MRLTKISLIIFLGLGLFHCSNENTTKKTVKVAQEELLPTIEKFNSAFQSGNVALLTALITEDYLHTNGNSKAIRKKEWLAYLNKREKEIKSGKLEVIDYKMDEIEIDFHESTAIVTGKVIVSNKREGKISKNEYRITNLWVAVNGSWKRAGFHDGKIK